MTSLLLKKHSGFTITELMVGLALAMILTLAVANVYIETRATFRTQAAQARLGDEGRFIMAMVQRMAFQAGYRDSANMTQTFNTTRGNMQNREIIDGTEQSMDVRFYGDPQGNIFSCANDTTGNASYPELKTSQEYAYSIYINSESKLVCAPLGGDGSQEQVLSENIPSDYSAKNLKFEYGIDNNGDQIADQYISPATTGNLDGSKVFSVKMCVVIRNNDAGLIKAGKKADGTTPARNYLDCDNNQITLNTNDTRLYRTFKTAVYLRNQIK
ncbi:PilW family protein [Chitinilyticum aquatile]|uniref:PilW family protein n=1 Tax=Chitinilyticum aquatile TaxID=362520 RepID=UPI0004915ABF|nr:PilW family protein [Chitinilyticum aquatile]